MSDLLNSASLVMIPSGYKEDVVYSQIPTDGSGDLSFTRASNGTRINSAGLVEVVAWNLVQQSETFDNATWSKSGIAVTANASANPLTGLTNADNLVAENVNNFHYINQSITYTSDQSTIFIYAKANGYTWLVIDTGLSNCFAYFNTTTGVVGTTGSSSTATIESVGNGWYKCILSFTAIAGSSNIYLSVRNADNGGSFTGNGTGGILVYGAQLNIGSTAKPYFPTTDRLNVPRLTYQNGGGGCPSLLLEKQSTNYFPYSQNISLWYAPADGVTLTSNTTDTVSPDGTYNASKITIVGGSKRSYEITNSVAGVGTFSAYVKAGTSNTIVLYTSSASVLIGYNLSTLAVTQTTGTGTITSVGNGWYRITATNTLGASEVLQVLYTGNANETIYIWGFQVEASSYVTSYIFTNGASATRVADSCFKTGISSLIGQTEGVLFAEIFIPSIASVGNFSSFTINDGTNSNLIDFTAYPTGRIQAVAIVGGSITVNIDLTGFGLTAGTHKIAFAYKLNDYVLYVDGVQVGADTSSLVPATSKFDLFTGLNSTSIYKQALLFKTRLTNAELASLTTI
jgi:hypothetical protein